MRHIGFTRPVRIGVGRRTRVAHHEVLEVPDVLYAGLKAEHGDALADLTPKAIGFPVFVPTRQTMIAFAPCGACLGRRTMTVCPACEGHGKIMVLA